MRQISPNRAEAADGYARGGISTFDQLDGRRPCAAKVTRASMIGLAAFPALREVDLRGLELADEEVAPLRAREISVRLR